MTFLVGGNKIIIIKKIKDKMKLSLEHSVISIKGKKMKI